VAIICIVTPPKLSRRSWIKQDAAILKEAGHKVILLEHNIISLIRKLKELMSCDLFFGWFAFPLAVFLSKAFGRPSLLNAVGYEVAQYPDLDYGLTRRWWWRTLISYGLKHATKIIAISAESARWARIWGADNVDIVYEGIDTSRFYPEMDSRREKKNKIILSVAYLSVTNVVRKNLVTLLRAVRLVIRKIPNVKLIIVGNKERGYYMLKRHAVNLGIEDHLVFLGHVPGRELIRLYALCDIFVLPSFQEGFPTVAAEAQACGKPIVTSNRPAMNEIYVNNVHAVLVDPRSPEELARAIIKVLEDASLRKRLSVMGRKLVSSKFSKERRAKKLLEVIQTLLKRPAERKISILWLFVTFCYTIWSLFLFIYEAMIIRLKELARLYSTP